MRIALWVATERIEESEPGEGVRKPTWPSVRRGLWLGRECLCKKAERVEEVPGQPAYLVFWQEWPVRQGIFGYNSTHSGDKSNNR